MHDDDKVFVKKCIESLPTQAYKQHAMINYHKVFDLAYEEEPISYKKNNAARKEANTRLRIFCNAVNKI